jgi:hypothetical protein
VHFRGRIPFWSFFYLLDFLLDAGRNLPLFFIFAFFRGNGKKDNKGEQDRFHKQD